jgi:long-chain acyl-CoA synthetase
LALKGVTSAELAADTGVRAVIEAHIETVNADLAQVETIKRFSILPHPFSIEKGEGPIQPLPLALHCVQMMISRDAGWYARACHAVTPTMKLKRNVIHVNYAAEIDAIYAQPFTRSDA